MSNKETFNGDKKTIVDLLKDGEEKTENELLSEVENYRKRRMYLILTALTLEGYIGSKRSEQKTYFLTEKYYEEFPQSL